MVDCNMAGVLGFEPRNVGVRVRCLTAWPYPNIDNIILTFYLFFNSFIKKISMHEITAYCYCKMLLENMTIAVNRSIKLLDS